MDGIKSSLSFAVFMLTLIGCIEYYNYRAGHNEPVWRECAPAQDGNELVSTTQWDDHTDCFYQKRSRIKFATQLRKERT